MALADRTYMRDEAPRQGSLFTVIILVINIAVFFAEYANGYQSRQAFLEYGALSLDGLKHGFLWQLITHQFHGPPKEIQRDRIEKRWGSPPWRN